ncbi:MAG TPA: NADH:flavin oxidoreductase/NADH oxidase, partial [Thermomicrobiales bacterium]|nr:NADH:flavin oxidoreductase/NADH oxidase [Thermomicrobiales bacterium]
MSCLFESVSFRAVHLRNRIGISPMCQYSSDNGFANDWHVVHLGSRAAGGAGMVMTEAAAVRPEGRISPQDLGVWDEAHVPGLARLAHVIRANGAVPAIQLAHAGRKAATTRPWDGGKPITLDGGAWRIVGPSPLAFSDAHQVPHELSIDELHEVIDAFGQAAQRSLQADFDIIEIHGAHGYLISSFLSATSNQRTDEYGGSFENRIRFLLEVVDRVRSVWPADKPLFVRISCDEWVPGGWNIGDSVALARQLMAHGVDLVDCSSGGNNVQQVVPTTPGYQVPFAAAIRQQTGMPTAAVGLITDPLQAEEIIASGQADMV